MKVLLFCCKGFELLEFAPFVDVMGWAGHERGVDITVETCGLERQVVSAFSVPVTVDRLLEEVAPEDYDALALPGGLEAFGYDREGEDGRVRELIQLFHRQGKPVAAVGIAGLLLAKSGILRGRHATCYHRNHENWKRRLERYGVRVVHQPVVVDGNVITSNSPETAPHVAFRLLHLLTDEEVTDQVRVAMGY